MGQTEDKKAKEKKKLSKWQIRTIIVSAISVAVALALIITNFFVPVKYLFSYMVLRNKGAEDGVMRVRFVDVGYGDCTIIELPDGKNMLIDAGNGISANEARILKYLNECDIDVIDYLVCSSVNAEHCGGLSEIIQFKTVKTIYMPYCENSFINDEFRDFVLAAKASDARIEISESGLTVKNQEYGYYFTFLSPTSKDNPAGEYADLNSKPSSKDARNNASAVIWLEYAGTSFLMTSDAGIKALEKICTSYEAEREKYYVNPESCTVITVADHGNKNSAYTDIYEITKPAVAIISVGENGQGCPSAEAMTNAANYVGENLYSTEVNGTVTVEVTKNSYSVVKEKQ